MKSIVKYDEFMEMIKDTCKTNFSRQLEMYLRNEVVLSFVSEEKEILDVGCNWAILSIYLANHGHQVTAVDINQPGLEVARKIAGRYRAELTFRLCDAEKLDFPDESFDLVIWEEMLEHLKEPLLALKEGFRVLRPKGKIILSAPNLASLRARIFQLLGLEVDLHPEHRHHFKPDSLSRLIHEAGFKIISLTSDFIPIPKLPLTFFLDRRKALARRYPSWGHHIIVYGQKE